MDSSTTKDILRLKRKNLDAEDIANILEIDINEVEKVFNISNTLNEVYNKRKEKKDNFIKTKKSTGEKKNITKIPKKQKINDKKIKHYEEMRRKENLISDYNSYKKNAILEIKHGTDVILYRNNFFNTAKELVKSEIPISLEDIKILADSVTTVPDLFKSYNIDFVIKCYEKYDAKDKIIDFIDDCRENENYYGNDECIDDLVKKYGELSIEEKENKRKRKLEKDKKVEKLIVVKKRGRKTKKKGLCEYLEGYSKEEVNKVLPTLTNMQKGWLNTYFDEDFNRTDISQKPGEIKELVRALKFRIEKERNEDNDKTKNLYEYFNDYTKDEVDLALSILTDYQKKKIKLYFYENLTKNNVPFKYNREKKNLLDAIQKRLIKVRNNKIEIIEKYNKLKGRKKKKIKETIYDYLDDYTKDEVVRILPTLTNKQKEILNKYFDIDLNRNNIPETEIRIGNLISAIKSRINKSRKKAEARITKNNGKPRKKNDYSDICENFNEYPREQVLLVANNLTKKAKIYRETYYDDELKRNDVPAENTICLSNLYNAIRTRLGHFDKIEETPEKSKEEPIEILEVDNSNNKIIEKKNFAEYFSDYDISFNIIKKLIEVDKDRQKFIYKYFDKNLNTTINTISEEDFAHLNQIIDHIKDLAEFEKKVREAKLQNKLGSLYGYDNEVQEENKEDAIKNNEEKHNSEPIEETTENIVDGGASNFSSDNLNVSNEDLINIYQMFKTKGFIEFLGQKSEIEIEVMKMKLGYQDQKYFSTKYIAKELNITEDEVIRIYKNIIKEYKEIILKELEKERQNNKKRMLTYE